MDAALEISSQPERVHLPRVVVADDSDDMRDLLIMVLRRGGFDVVGAADGDAALEAILNEGADGLVSDLRMPRVDGLTLCRCLRALTAYARLPIVVYTGAEHDDERLREFRAFSALRVLNKPAGLGDIAPSLAEMMKTAVR